MHACNRDVVAVYVTLELIKGLNRLAYSAAELLGLNVNTYLLWELSACARESKYEVSRLSTSLKYLALRRVLSSRENGHVF